jgi:hypothetical protein
LRTVVRGDGERHRDGKDGAWYEFGKISGDDFQVFLCSGEIGCGEKRVGYCERVTASPIEVGAERRFDSTREEPSRDARPRRTARQPQESPASPAHAPRPTSRNWGSDPNCQGPSFRTWIATAPYFRIHVSNAVLYPGPRTRYSHFQI